MIVLDTHVWVWWVHGDAKLPKLSTWDLAILSGAFLIWASMAASSMNWYLMRREI